MYAMEINELSQLGRAVEAPNSPEEAVLEKVPNP
ncbi:MAG: NADPH-dependent 7-cyano-7-deazaguanine reductase QueF, partial [Alphaproteobacteria bacterium]|nr:NADPH-dependent 7-cyano-7-deazaguanine reductase QueF [Alphaproteobacteria bacterium]